MPTVTTTVTSTAASGVVTTQTVTEATPDPAPLSALAAAATEPPIDPKSPLVVYNWPMLGRFGGQFLMLDYAGIEYEHVMEYEELAARCSAFGARNTATFAPPVIVDGDFVLSQSYAQCIYIGRKAGLETGSFCQFKATQLLADIDDWLLNSFKPGIKTLTSTEYLKTFLEGADGNPGRFSNFATTVEFNIQGPFTFGAEPSCVDFYLANMLDMIYHTILRKLQDHTGADVLAEFPKIAAVWKSIKDLPSYKARDRSEVPVMMTDEWFLEAGYAYYVAAGVVENY